MPWIWCSASGALFRQDVTPGDPPITDMQFVWHGYSGNGHGVNNPLYEDIANVGPIPQGWYSIGDPRDHPRLGAYALPLTADAQNKMHGRSGFYIHGDNSTPEPLDGSHGCIVLPRQYRERIIESGIRRLRVVDI